MSIFPRARITKALRESANCGVAMVVAPAGFGKSEAIRDAFGPGAHVITPARGDVSAETIARLLIERVAPRARRSLNSLLQRPRSEENREHLAEWCASRLQAVEQPIVVEDFERLSGEAETLRFLQRVTEATAPRTRWIFASRETPALPIVPWLARDLMTPPLTASDLAFQPAEALGLAAAMNVEIDPQSIETLVAELGDWPLALRLALSSWERTRAVPPLRIRTRTLLFEYLETEVWSQLSDDEQRLLAAAAHLSELRPQALAAAGFPESQATLQRLHGRLLLLAQVGDGSYHLHDLFREFVLDRTKRDPVRYSGITSTLAGALERTGSIDEAIALQLDAAAWDDALRLLEAHGVERIESGSRSTIQAALQRLPQTYRRHPVVAGLRGYNLALDAAGSAEQELRLAVAGEMGERLRGQLKLRLGTVLANATGRANEAIAFFQDVTNNETLDIMTRMTASGSLAVVLANCGQAAQAREALAFCSGALEMAPADLRARLHHRIAYTHLCLGEFGATISHANKCLELALALGLESEASRAHSLLAAIAWAQPDEELALAREHSQAQTLHALAAGDRVLAVAGMVMEMAVAADGGEDELFADAYRRLQAHHAQMPHRQVVSFAWYRVIQRVGLGDRYGALRMLQQIELDGLQPEERFLLDSMVALLIAETQADEARRLLKRTVTFGEELEFEPRHIVGHGHLLRALAQWLLGLTDVAGRLRREPAARVNTRNEAFKRVVIEIVSTPRRSLTKQRLDDLTEPLVANLAGQARFLRMLLAPPAADASRLTPAELDVLRELRRGGTTDAIAGRMGKSSHTILAHLRSACSKIGCSGRAAAVSHAVEHGWLD